MKQDTARCFNLLESRANPNINWGGGWGGKGRCAVDGDLVSKHQTPVPDPP